MVKKIILALVIIGAAWFLYCAATGSDEVMESHNDSMAESEGVDSTVMDESEQKEVVDGKYVIQAESSVVNWAGKKPLVDGYINSGKLSLTSGEISMTDGVVSGNLTIDMNTLSVFDTPKKPGKESMLEDHLKGERWFNVAGFPEASFVITEATPQADVGSTFMYDVTGDLTLKGQTHSVTFPAKVYLSSENELKAEASFEFDRTKWGITAGSGSFFDNLADNVVDDMVALSFNLVANK